MSDAALEVEVGANVSNGIAGIEKIRQKLRDLYAQMDDAKARQAELINPKNIRDAQKEIDKIGREIDKIGNNQGFSNLGSSASRALGPINDAYGAIRKIAYILPGIGIAGIFNLIFEAISGATKETNGANKALKEYQKTIDQIVSKTAEESTKVETLVAQLQKGTLSRKETADSIRELQKISPEYFGNLNAEKSSVEDITKAYAAYNAQVVAAIETQIKLKDIQDIVAKRLDFEKSAKDASAEFANLLSQGKSLAEIAKIANDRVSDQNRSLNQLLNSEKGRFATGKDILNQQGLEAAALQQIVHYRQQEADIIDSIQQSVAKKETSKDVDEGKARLSVLEEIKRITDELRKPSTAPIFRQAENANPAGIDAEVLRQKITEAIQGGIKDPANQDVFQQLANVLGLQLKKILNPDLKIPIRFDLQGEGKIEDISKVLEKQFGKLDKTAGLHLTIAGFNQDSVAQALADAKKLANDINHILSRGIGNAVQGFGETFGAAIASGVSPIKAAGQSILEAVGGLMQTIGKALVEYGIVKLGLDHILEGGIAIPGGVALALGAAAIALGALVKNLGHAKAFAEGGIVTGPTMGLVGEAGPEAIIPLRQLPSIFGNMRGSGAQVVYVRGRLSGQDMLISNARASKNNNLRG